MKIPIGETFNIPFLNSMKVPRFTGKSISAMACKVKFMNSLILSSPRKVYSVLKSEMEFLTEGCSSPSGSVWPATFHLYGLLNHSLKISNRMLPQLFESEVNKDFSHTTTLPYHRHQAVPLFLLNRILRLYLLAEPEPRDHQQAF